MVEIQPCQQQGFGNTLQEKRRLKQTKKRITPIMHCSDSPLNITVIVWEDVMARHSFQSKSVARRGEEQWRGIIYLGNRLNKPFISFHGSILKDVSLAPQIKCILSPFLSFAQMNVKKPLRRAIIRLFECCSIFIQLSGTKSNDEPVFTDALIIRAHILKTWAKNNKKAQVNLRLALEYGFEKEPLNEIYCRPCHDCSGWGVRISHCPTRLIRWSCL